MFYQLPPVGNTVLLSGDNGRESSLRPVFSPYVPYYFSSGTAALAAALIAAIKKKGVRHPEVILPAYGCPDLISAVVFAGAKPVLVDLEAGRTWMALEAVAAAIDADTVAIVAVNLLGIPERMDALRSLVRQAGIVLVEDSAQYFPGGCEPPDWQGDFVILSFGRGKPASLLGGGAVLAGNAELAGLLPDTRQPPVWSVHDELSYRLKVVLYNVMSSPRLYWLPQGLPFLHIGETRYHALEDIDAMRPAVRRRLAVNIEAYRGADMGVQKAIVAMVGEIDPQSVSLVDLPAASGISRDRRLLRYPLLLGSERRDRVYAELRRQGLGPSLLYPTVLPGLPGLEALLANQGPFPVAEDFAARILTLPTHRRVRGRDIRAMGHILSDT